MAYSEKFRRTFAVSYDKLCSKRFCVRKNWIAPSVWCRVHSLWGRRWIFGIKAVFVFMHLQAVDGGCCCCDSAVVKRWADCGDSSATSRHRPAELWNGREGETRWAALLRYCSCLWITYLLLFTFLPFVVFVSNWELRPAVVWSAKSCEPYVFQKVLCLAQAPVEQILQRAQIAFG
jgi:hypothetical protein